MLNAITNGRTDMVTNFLSSGRPATTTDDQGVSLIQWCAYYGDTSAIRQLLAGGETLASLGDNYDLNGAAFHGHWQLCQFLIECGADANHEHAATRETALHAALSQAEENVAERVVEVLLANQADPNRMTAPGVETGCFMRDARTRAETPLHRAAAFGSERAIKLLLDAGAKIDARDMNGDTPLSWASWHRRPDGILRLLCYGDFTIHPDRRPLRESLLGLPVDLAKIEGK